MQSKKKTITTVETWQRTVLSRGQTVWCGHCAAEVEVFSLAQAADVSNTGEQTIVQWIESGELHFIKMPEDNLLICGSSLSKKV